MGKKVTDEVRPDLAIRLREAREARGFADAKAATKFHGWVYDSYVQHENGNRGIRRDVAERYATAYRIRLAWLLTGESPRDVAAAPVRFRGSANRQQPNARSGDREALARALDSLTPEETARAKALFDLMFPSKTSN